MSESFPDLPRSGPLPRPLSVDEAADTLKAERIPLGNIQKCEFVCDEFTTLCPRTGQPDFGRVLISYLPRRFGLESKALKFYLWSFRESGAFCEALAERIADDVFAAIEPTMVTITVEQRVRGGIALTVQAIRMAN